MWGKAEEFRGRKHFYLSLMYCKKFLLLFHSMFWCWCSVLRMIPLVILKWGLETIFESHLCPAAIHTLFSPDSQWFSSTNFLLRGVEGKERTAKKFYQRREFIVITGRREGLVMRQNNNIRNREKEIRDQSCIGWKRLMQRELSIRRGKNRRIEQNLQKNHRDDRQTEARGSQEGKEGCTDCDHQREESCGGERECSLMVSHVCCVHRSAARAFGISNQEGETAWTAPDLLQEKIRLTSEWSTCVYCDVLPDDDAPASSPDNHQLHMMMIMSFGPEVAPWV